MLLKTDQELWPAGGGRQVFIHVIKIFHTVPSWSQKVGLTIHEGVTHFKVPAIYMYILCP